MSRNRNSDRHAATALKSYWRLKLAELTGEKDYTSSLEELKEKYRNAVIAKKRENTIAPPQPDNTKESIEQQFLDTKPIPREEYDRGIDEFYQAQNIADNMERNILRKKQRVESRESPLIYGIGGKAVDDNLCMSMKDIMELLAEKERKEKEDKEMSVWRF